MLRLMKGITQRDLARLLNVHQTTVSYILSGARAEKFSLEMRQRVTEAAKQYGYRPSLTARNLRGVSKTGIIGVFHFGSHKDVESFRLREVVNAIHAHNYRPLAVSMSSQIMWVPNDEKSACSVLEEVKVEGIVLSGYADQFDLNQLARFHARNVPVVSVNVELKLPGIPLFGADRYEAAYELTSHLIANGRRKLLCLHRWPSSLVKLAKTTGFRAVEGFRAAAEDHGISPDAIRVVIQEDALTTGLNSFESGEKGMEEGWQHGFRPDAVICYDDSWAVGVYGWLARKGLRVPDDVAVVGFENQDIGNHLHPRLTSVRVPYQDMSAKSLDYLVGVLQGNPASPEMLDISKCSLVLRESCGRNARGDTSA